MAKNSKYSPAQIDEVVAKAQKGDTDSFAVLYHLFVDDIHRYVFYRVNREDALDLTESIFLRVWENIRSYKTGKKYFSSWLYRIAHNMVVDHYRMTKEVSPLEVDIADHNRESDPVKMAEQSLSSDMLKVALSKLKKKYQQVILLHYMNGLENREIARIMRRTEGNMRILKFRALRALRKVLEDMGAKY